jgi:hypothetical protein
MNKLQSLDELTAESVFYSKPFKFSYSSINKLLFSPSTFYKHYVLNQREDKTDAYLVEGKLIHCLYLEPENFDKLFILQPVVPSENTKQVIDRVYQMYVSSTTVVDPAITLGELSEQILSVLLEMNLHQSLKTDAQRIEKITSPGSSDPYFAFIKTKDSKSIVDTATYERCKVIVDKLKNNEKVYKVMKPKTQENFIVHNEVYLDIENYKDLQFGFKGIIDNITIDLASRTIFINDIKTTSKSITDFPESVDFYKYWIQCVIYHTLIRNFGDIDGYIQQGFNLKFNFIVIDRYNQICNIPVSKATMDHWMHKFEEEVLPQVEYHYVKNDYELPYQFALGLVEL